MKLLYTIVACILIVSAARSQDNIRSVGIRGGYSSGFTYQTFLDEESAFEVLVSFRDKGIQANFLLEKHRPVFIGNSMTVFCFSGFGGHTGYSKWQDVRNYRYNNTSSYYYNTKYSPVVGFDVIFGLDFHLNRAPFILGANYKPFMELFGERIFRVNLSDFAFQVRYTFN